MRGIVGIGSARWKALQESINGRYVRAPNGETHNGSPVWIRVCGTRFLYRATGGRWTATHDRAKFAGWVCSTSYQDFTPVDATGWGIMVDTARIIDPGISVSALTSAYFPLR